MKTKKKTVNPTQKKTTSQSVQSGTKNSVIKTLADSKDSTVKLSDIYRDTVKQSSSSTLKPVSSTKKTFVTVFKKTNKPKATTTTNKPKTIVLETKKTTVKPTQKRVTIFTDKPKVATSTLKPVFTRRKQVLNHVEKPISQHQTKVTTNKPKTTQNSALHQQAVKPSSDLVRLACCFM